MPETRQAKRQSGSAGSAAAIGRSDVGTQPYRRSVISRDQASERLAAPWRHPIRCRLRSPTAHAVMQWKVDAEALAEQWPAALPKPPKSVATELSLSMQELWRRSPENRARPSARAPRYSAD